MLNLLEAFVLRVYYPKKLDVSSLGRERFAHFKRHAACNLRQLPLSRPALLEHVNRACIQGGWLWRESLHNVVVPDVTMWGWRRGDDGGLIPRWQDGEDTVTVDNVTQTCTCRTSGCKSCKCKKANLPCLPFCVCEKKCTNVKL